MNPKQLLLILVAGCVVVATAVLVSQQRTAAYRPSQHQSTKLLASFDPNTITQVTIRADTNTVSLIKTDAVWGVHERANYPADFGKVSALLRKFWELTRARSVPVGPSRLTALRLEGAAKGSIEVALRSDADTLVHSVTIGTNMVNQSDEWPGSRYVMVDADPQSVALVNDTFPEIELSPAHWINKDFIKVDNVIRISVASTNAAAGWTLTRADTSADWTLTDAGKDETLDTSKTSGLNNILSSARINDVIISANQNESGLDQPTVATIDNKDGFTYTIDIGSTSGGDRHIRVKVNASLPESRIPGTDEKPENKEKLDKEFTATIARLQSKLETEKRLEKHIYLVPEWTLESLLRPRSDLLKQPEPAGTGNAATGEVVPETKQPPSPR
jgi:hypothetical protein